jgi:hypothetical protein
VKFTRKWAAARLAPKKYGDRVEHDHKGGLNFQPAVLVQIGGGEREDDAKLLEGGLANYRLRSLGGVGGP